MKNETKKQADQKNKVTRYVCCLSSTLHWKNSKTEVTLWKRIKSNIFHPRYRAGGSWKVNNHQLFLICNRGKLGQGNYIKIFSVHTKWQSRRFISNSCGLKTLRFRYGLVWTWQASEGEGKGKDERLKAIEINVCFHISV